MWLRGVEALKVMLTAATTTVYRGAEAVRVRMQVVAAMLGAEDALKVTVKVEAAVVGLRAYHR